MPPNDRNRYWFSFMVCRRPFRLQRDESPPNAQFEHEKLFRLAAPFDYVRVNRSIDEKKPVSCRLEPKFNEALEGRAAELKMTKSDLVRNYVMAGLAEDATTVTLHEELPALREELKQLRRDLSLLAEVLLVRAGNVDPAKARTWAMENLAAR